MSLAKLSAIFAAVGLFFFAHTTTTYAFPRELFVSFAFPVRQVDQLDQSTTSLTRALVPLASASATPLSWYLDYDVLSDATQSGYFNSLSTDPNQEIGVLLEVTPQLLTVISLPAGSVPLLLNSYLPQDRIRLIDIIFEKFYANFGRYPASVAAPYIDSYSLSYLHDHYSIAAAVFTDPPQNVFPYFPYYPSRFNSSLPAQTEKNRLPVVVSFLNPPDLQGNPFNPQKTESLLEDFALKDLNENTRLVFGFANHQPVSQSISSFNQLVSGVIAQRHPLSISRLTVADFGEWFSKYYPLTSPAYHYRSLSPDKSLVYYHNPFYQIKLEQVGDQTATTHLSVFNELFTEEYRLSRNLSQTLDLTLPPVIGKDNPLPVKINLTTGQYTPRQWRLEIADYDRILEFTPHQIKTKNLALDLAHPQVSFSRDHQILTLNSSWFPFNTSPAQFLINGLKLLVLLFLIYSLAKLFGYEWSLKSVGGRLPLLLILAGSFVWSITAFKSGSHTQFGLSFWGPHGHDAFVHLALIESFKHSLYPLINPTLVDTLVVNYHILFDYLSALLSRFLNIPSLDLYFRYLLPALALAIGLLSASLMRRLKFSTGAIALSLILIFTAGSLGFVRSSESLFWANQAISTLINPPFALSLVLLLLYFHLFSLPLTWIRVFLLVLLSGLLVQAKAYAAVLLVMSLGLYLVYLLLSAKLTRYHLALFVLTLIIVPLFLLPTYSGSSSLFIFSPLWFVKSLVSSPDRLYLPKVAEALLNYPLQNQLVKFVALEIGLTFVFLIGNIGLRFFALPYIFRFPRHLPQTHLLMFFIILFGTLLPLLFIQSANPWNTIQFFYYSLFFLAFFSGPTLAALFYRQRKLPAFLLLSLLVIAGTLPTTYIALRDYLSPTPAAFIGYQELLNLDRLSRLPRGLVISPEYNVISSRPYSDPRPIFAYTSTAYVSALSGQPSLIADEINLQISNYDYKKVAQDQRQFYRTTSSTVVQEILNRYSIQHVLNNPQFPGPFFDGHNFSLYSVNK